MIELKITGWIDDAHVKPVSLVHELRASLGLGLREAKEILDEISENGSAIVRVESMERLRQVRSKLSDLGVTSTIVSE
jgi:ribosomal protein L7/L12